MDGAADWNAYERLMLSKGRQMFGDRAPCKIARLLPSRSCAQVAARLAAALDPAPPKPFDRSAEQYVAELAAKYPKVRITAHGGFLTSCLRGGGADRKIPKGMVRFWYTRV